MVKVTISKAERKETRMGEHFPSIQKTSTSCDIETHHIQVREASLYLDLLPYALLFKLQEEKTSR